MLANIRRGLEQCHSRGRQTVDGGTPQPRREEKEKDDIDRTKGGTPLQLRGADQEARGNSRLTLPDREDSMTPIRFRLDENPDGPQITDHVPSESADSRLPVSRLSWSAASGGSGSR